MPPGPLLGRGRRAAGSGVRNAVLVAEILLGLLIAVAGLATVAGKLGVPYPIVLVLGGLALGFVPGLPRIELAPDLLFLLFLPPLIYSGSVFSSPRDLRANLRPIGMLAIGLVLATMGVVAAVAHAVLGGITWATAFVLGTIVSGTDVVAASSIMERLRVPRRIVTVLEGEGLLNDPVSLVAYRLAVGAVVTGAFSLSQAGLQFLEAAVGGTLIGWVVGWLMVEIRRRLDDPPVEMTVSLLTPFAAYLPAEWLGLSGVVSVAAAGLYVGRVSHVAISPETRIRSQAVWQMLVFLLNSFLFILLGFQSRAILDELSGRSLSSLLGLPVLLCATVILVRIVWVFVFTYLPRAFSRRRGAHGRRPSWKQTAIIAWTGLRGVDTLATALALPFVTAGRTPFPQRSLIIYLSFCVILVTLLLQGLSLPVLIRWRGVGKDRAAEQEETRARLAAVRAAVARLDALAGEEGVSDEMLRQLRSRYQHRADHLKARCAGTDDGTSPEHLSAHQRLSLEALDAERHALLQLRNRGEISDDVLRRVERDLDLEELRLEA